MTSAFDVEDVSSLGDAELLTAVVEVERRRRVDYFRELAVVAELESRGVAAPMGYSDVAAILRESLRLNPTVARRQVRHARALIGDLSPSSGQRLGPALPMTAEALADGAISVDHVETIRAAMAALPCDTSTQSREGAEKILAAAARTCEPAAVARLGREILDRLDQDGKPPDDDELADPRRTLHMRTTRRGRLRGSFDLDAETGAHLTNLIAGGITPDKPDDQRIRTLAERQGDAFAEIIAEAATDSGRPTEAGSRSRCSCPPAPNRSHPGSDTACSTGTSTSPSHTSAGCPATAMSSRQCSAQTANSSTSVAEPALCPSPFAER